MTPQESPSSEPPPPASASEATAALPAWRRRGTSDQRAIVLICSVIVVVAWIRLAYRPGLADWDIMGFYLPWYAHMGEGLRTGDIPGWNPHIFSGTSFVGNPQSGWAYLPVMVLFTALPALQAFAISIWLHLVGAAVATYALARLLGTGVYASLVGGLAYALSANLGVATCCTNHLQLAPWLPLSFIGVELSLRQPSLAGRLAALSVSAFAFSQMAAAWVGQGTYNAALLLGSYLVWRSVGVSLTPDERLWRRLRRTAINGTWVFGLGAGLAAMGLLPRLDVVRRSYVGSEEYQGAGFEADRGLDWWRVAEVLLRFRLDWFPYHLGGAVVTLALIGAVVAWRRQALIYFVLAAVVIVILPMRPTPLHDIFYLLPRFRDIHLHDPARIFAILPLPVSVLAGAGVDALRRRLSSRQQVVAAFLIAGFWTGALWLDLSKAWALHWTTWAAVGLIGVACLANHLTGNGRFVERAQRAAQIAVALIVTAVLLDPAAYASYRWIEAGNDPVAETVITRSTSEGDPGGAGQLLQGREAAGEVFRYFGYVDPQGPDYQAHEDFADPVVLGLLANNRAMRLGLEDVQGYDPAQLVRYQDVFAAINGFERDYHKALIYREGLDSPLLNLLGVRYVIAPVGDGALAEAAAAGPMGPRYREVFTNGVVRVYENDAALPRAWLVHEARQASPPETLASLGSGTVDPRLVALLEEAPPALQPLAGAESTRIVTREPDRVALEVSAASDGLLILGDVYDPGWSAYVDGDRSTIYTVDTIFRGVAVPAGSHTVEFRYEPRSLRIGLAISGLTALVVVTVATACAWTGRRRGPLYSG